MLNLTGLTTQRRYTIKNKCSDRPIEVDICKCNFSLFKAIMTDTDSPTKPTNRRIDLGWEFMKEKKKVRKQENSNSSKKKRTRSRKHVLDQERVHEKREWSRNYALDQENDQEKEIFKLGEISINLLSTT